MRYQNVLFDLDGTLTDPKIGITKSVQYALAKFGIHEPDLTKLEFFIGPPLQNTFMETYSFSSDKAWKAVEYYREYFRDHGIYENKLYGGMLEVLELLRSQGRTLFVATSKPSVFAHMILSHFQMDSFFTFVSGAELDGTRSDKSEIIKHIIDNYRLDPSDTVMIGDRKHDLIGAHNNNVHSIAVSFGYGSEEELMAADPTYLIHTVQELLQSFSMVEV
ncbi:HAD family hydrolase [Paenibacillus sp. N3/727]|nr:HAD family hydrolase [Paenibacillus sp. N3/727]UNK21256.1 HAD family hydrolase [Paenibacillus sp. N3/727]